MTENNRLDAVTDASFRRLCEETVNEMDRLAVPGVVVGVLHEDNEFIAGFGVTNVDHPLAVTEDTLFQIGSITKTYLATAVMRLVEMEKLDLDVPVRTYLPDLKLADETVAAQVTVRHLLTHTGGWVGDYFNDFGMGAEALSRMVAEMATLPQLTPLGKVWSYNNSGFYIAGRVIEVVTGTAFETAMQSLVFDPLGLQSSFFFPHDVMTHRYAVGHNIVENEPRVARPWAVGRAAHPAGGIICNMEDLFRYARFHMGDGTAPDGSQLLSRASLALMHTPFCSSTGLNKIGLSWVITEVDGTRMIGHGGGTKGQNTLLRIVPSEKFAVAVFTNSNTGGTLCDRIVDAATQTYLGLTMPEAAPLERSEEVLQPYVGRYEAAMNICDISILDGRLILQVTPKGGFPTPDTPPSPAPSPVRAALYEDDRLVILDEPMKDRRAEFLRDAENNIAWLRLGGRIHVRQA